MNFQSKCYVYEYNIFFVDKGNLIPSSIYSELIGYLNLLVRGRQ